MNKYVTFLRWFLPLVMVYLLLVFYLLSQGYISYVYGVGYKQFYVQSEKADFAIRPADKYEGYESQIVVYAKPGESVQQRFRLANYVGEDREFEVYLGSEFVGDEEFVANADGDLEYPSLDVSEWTQIPEMVELPKLSDEAFSFTVKIPEGQAEGIYEDKLIVDAVAKEGAVVEPVEVAGPYVKVNIAYARILRIIVSKEPFEGVITTWDQDQTNALQLANLHLGLILINGLFLTFLFFMVSPFKKI